MQKAVVLFLLLWGFGITLSHAKGTLAGTAIQNSAQIHCSVGGIDQNLTSNTDSFVVDKIIDLDITWQDTNPVEVSAGEQDRVLTFVLSNLGNGDDNVTLTYEHNSSSHFLPENAQLFQDSNTNGIFEPGVDMLIGDITLAADTNTTLFIVADIPDGKHTGGDLSRDGIKADSQNSATVGVDNPDAVDVVIRSGSDSAEGVYVIRDYWLVSQKHAVVDSDDNQTHTGTIITYTIDLFIGGNATGRSIDHLILADSIPSGTTYQAGSLKLNGVSLSDAVDGDRGDYAGNEVHVDVGSLRGTVHQPETFDVQVQ
jgi:uncharacterized repeat protein (TIGR01451 family)